MTVRNGRALIPLLITLLVVAGCSRKPSRAIPDPMPLGGDITLTDQNGRRFSTTSLRGDVVLVFFGFTHCPDACPMMLSRISRVRSILGRKANDVKTVFVSVDPARDTPAVLKEYLSNFSGAPIGLTGTKEEIDGVIGQYKGTYEIKGGEVNHTTYLYILDKEGQTRGLFSHSSPPEDIAELVELLL
jgi:protein SCO1/2